MALIDKYPLYEDKCLIFSESNQTLEKIIERKIDFLFKKTERILLITSFTFFREDWQCSSKIVKWNFETLWEKYCSSDFDLKASFDAIIIFEEKEDDRLSKFILDILKAFSYIFVALKREANKTFQIFQENSLRFAYLNFQGSFISEAKIFEKPINKKILDDDRFSSKTQEILAKFYCPLTIISRNAQISEDIVRKRIDLLNNNLGLQNDEILIFFDYEFQESHFQADSFWQVCKKLFNRPLTLVFKEKNIREEFFNFLSFEKKYKAFIIIAPFFGNPLLMGLISKIKDLHKNILWLSSQSGNYLLQFSTVDDLFSNYEKGVANESERGRINVETNLIDYSKLKDDPLFSSIERKDFVFDKSINEEEPNGELF